MKIVEKGENCEVYNSHRNRGIKFSFVSFDEFFKDLGKKPNGSTLDRIKNDGNYEPGNVRWATHRQQMLNRRERLFCFRGHPFIPENTFTYKNGVRTCRICMRVNHREYKRRARQKKQ